MAVENVNHPEHYNKNGMEVIDIIESFMGVNDTMAFCKANAIKYILRSDFKGKGSEDIDKAIWYLKKYQVLFNRKEVNELFDKI